MYIQYIEKFRNRIHCLQTYKIRKVDAKEVESMLYCRHWQTTVIIIVKEKKKKG